MRLLWAMWRVWSVASPNRRIFAGAMTIGLITAGAKVIGIANELVVAANFGRSDQLEAFLLAVLIPQALAGILGGSFQAAVIPALVRTEQKDGRVAADRLFGRLIGIALPALAVGAAGIALSGSLLLPWIAGGFSPAKLALTRDLLLTATPMAVLGALSVMLTAPLHGRERFAFAALTPVLTPIAMITGILWVGASGSVLIVSTLLGQVAEVALLVYALHRAGHRPWPIWSGPVEGLRAVIHQWWPAIAASTIQGGTTLVDQIMAAHLLSGSVSALSYAQRLVVPPLGLAIGILSPALTAVLARSFALQTRELDRIADWWRRRLLWLSATGAVLVIIFSPWITAAMYERGSFTSHDSAEVAVVVAALAPMAPWYLVGSINIRLLNIRGGNHYLPVIASVNLIANLVGNLILAPRYGVVGIAMVTSLMSLMSFIQIEWCLARLKKIHVSQSATVDV